MCDEWMTAVELPITLEQFHRLPRHPAFKYEYLDQRAFVVPRPKFYHSVLNLTNEQAQGPAGDVQLRLLQDSDLVDLETVFAAAFDHQQPFAGLDAPRRREAARQAFRKVSDGGDGPWIRKASFIALDRGQHPVGAILITLLPDGDPSRWDSYYWHEPPPVDGIERCLGRPHVTWVFVGPWNAGCGIGTALLAASVNVLRPMGYKHLASTFLLGNESSMLWHWRNGFQLQAYPYSPRRFDHPVKQPDDGAEQ
jgi:hypothetical protein